MRKMLFIAGAAGLLLISASPPSDDGTGTSTAHGDESTAVMSDSDAGPPAARESGPRPTARVGYYPPCTATRQDRCTQIGGRGRAYARSHARSRKMQLASRRAGERG